MREFLPRLEGTVSSGLSAVFQWRRVGKQMNLWPQREGAWGSGF